MFLFFINSWGYRYLSEHFAPDRKVSADMFRVARCTKDGDLRCLIAQAVWRGFSEVAVRGLDRA